jgi:hypothetical protein
VRHATGFLIERLDQKGFRINREIDGAHKRPGQRQILELAKPELTPRKQLDRVDRTPLAAYFKMQFGSI